MVSRDMRVIVPVQETFVSMKHASITFQTKHCKHDHIRSCWKHEYVQTKIRKHQITFNGPKI